jgi:hypothetical protein
MLGESFVDTVRRTGQVQAAARKGRFGLLLALLLVLLGVSTGAGNEYTGPHRPSVISESASATPSMHDDLHDWLRLSMTARHAPTTALPTTCWAVCARATDECALPERSLIGEVSDTGMAAEAATPRSSRAPPAV